MELRSKRLKQKKNQSFTTTTDEGFLKKLRIGNLVLSSAIGSSLREILENVCHPETFFVFPE